MNTSELLSYCMNKPGVEQSVQSGWKATQIKSNGILFAMVHEVKGRPAVSLKSTPALADLIREEHADVFPSEHLNKSHWNTLFLDGSLKDSQIYYLVDASFQQADNTK
ncbi:MmcQ/YjbR family DNA-binding protein [Mixta mediterraneensis]|uniref:MmcQ/YjbR family DNA-binding protein n=1 Tax=Mixta mediterraneensis TaxID=2758443 RepID=UPI0018736264|nr:MmcQ/YjbR family DNA-binding protein [Mixta mediterraneensis]MBE5253437.1 MmcQ/YjbR family DNA-binding protein [Mixta mediterraneensis]